MTDARQTSMNDFLTGAGWGDADIAPLAVDASTRSYLRLEGTQGHAVLMNAPPGEEEPACPPDADEATRRALGYNALARLAGPDARPFVAMAEFLRSNGFSAPTILAADFDQGFLLLEDLGDDIFNPLLDRGANAEQLYGGAIDVQLALHQIEAPAALPLPGGGNVPLLEYDAVALAEEVRLLTDWYLPNAAGTPTPGDIGDEFVALWREALDPVMGDNTTVVLRDYHADNLLWLPDRPGIARVGLLDFQDGLRGSRAYDLVSLLEDARRDVPRDLQTAMLDRYVRGAKALDPQFNAEAFATAYAILGLQRNTKILGIFARLWRRDGKPQYPSYMPRLWRYIDHDLAHPAAAKLKSWFEAHVPPNLRGDHLARLAATEAG